MKNPVPVIVLAQLFGTSLWFSANSAADDMIRTWGIEPADLDRWADRLREVGAGWDDAVVYFKHEDAGKGPEFARTFAEILNKR